MTAEATAAAHRPRRHKPARAGAPAGAWTACLLAAVAATTFAAAPTGQTPAAKPAKQADWPKPKPVPATSPKALEASIRRGVDFLLKRQNPHGSWGSAHNTKGSNILTPVPGGHLAMRAAVTALCVSALIECGDSRPAAGKAIAGGEAWLDENLPNVRRATPRVFYNVWAHAYGIQALVRLMRRAGDNELKQRRYRKLIQDQIERLDRIESVNGGWGYYDFRYRTRKPGGQETSFTTATVLIALREAMDAGVAPPGRLVQRGLAALRRQQNPNFTYWYSAGMKWRPAYLINRASGSLGRSQACNLALRVWKDERITDTVLTEWLDRLFARNLWLDLGRKRPVPHESYAQVAGYFYYYGHYYGAQCIEQLPPAARRPHQQQMAHILLKHQEKDGSWWDFPLYDYHQQYGTAMAIMSLVRCRPAPTPPPEP